MFESWNLKLLPYDPVSGKTHPITIILDPDRVRRVHAPYPLGLFTNTQTQSFPLSSFGSFVFWLGLSLLQTHATICIFWTIIPFPPFTTITLSHSYPLLPSSLNSVANVRIPTSAMGVVRHHRRHKHHHWLPTLFTTFTFLLFSSTSAITTLATQPSKCNFTNPTSFSTTSLLFSPNNFTSHGAFSFLFSGGEAVKQPHHREEKEKGWTAAPSDGGVVMVDEKRFGLPGSSPPSCRSKCGWCNPCQPVHVPVQPGLIIRLEYYPEAWRCKCGNKLFMP